MAKIIILNAPPGAGKDTIGKMISFYSPGEQCRIISFKEPMFDIALAILVKRTISASCWLMMTESRKKGRKHS
ncbi:hypothetical protein DDONNNOJ_00007 [Citrobacter phage BSwS KMM3]|nr:hypothetical protein DDONNNOJ_00007 [Citrobacter phage BSwS KMM3]